MENQWNNPNLAEDLKLLDEVIKSIRQKLKMKEYNRLRYKNNPEKQKENVRLWYQNNREKQKENVRLWQRNNSEKYLETRRKREKFRRLTDPLFRMKENLRRRLRHALKNNSKSSHTFELIGCNINELKLHLEKQFKTGMSWDNRGQWHIDHIRPCASFDLSKPEEQAKCFHFSNLQPLWATDNLKKSDKMPDDVYNMV